MQTSHRSVQYVVVLFFIVFTIVQSQESESRRAVSEHQLMHDRGRSIQSLKRLIWLSGAIEGLHTAQTRAAVLSPPDILDLHLNPAAGNPQPKWVQKILRDLLTPHLKE
ncbi:parathyroid hormone 4 [Sphaeramia orbicularis]|uniref:parathyroid hormone 4 n=1 Tax=Sphaeramia orbicularis TaxID=375764 RepID=UPI001180762C|nr:parathyroid hormone 4-like [Sphaeramia orbicularis]XP_029990812.1 parathyroid hormone 4-like [Sphaeramia orbicularis]